MCTATGRPAARPPDDGPPPSHPTLQRPLQGQVWPCAKSMYITPGPITTTKDPTARR